MVECECSSSGFVPSAALSAGRSAGPLGGEDAGRVLDVDAVEVRVGRELRGEVDVERVVVHGADRVGQGADDLADAGLLEPPGGLSGGVHVVHRVQDDDPVDPVGRQPVVDQLHGLRVRVLPRDETEPRSDELELCGRHLGSGEPDPLPRILPVDAHSDTHGGAR